MFAGNRNAFWSAGVAFSYLSSNMNEDVNTTWKHNERTPMVDGIAGYMVRGVGLYGGLRLVRVDAELEETDSTNVPGQKIRSTDLERDNPLDLIIGARTGGAPVAGFVELGVIGSFSVTAGFAFGFQFVDCRNTRKFVFSSGPFEYVCNDGSWPDLIDAPQRVSLRGIFTPV